MTTIYFRNEIIYEFCYNRMANTMQRGNGNDNTTGSHKKQKWIGVKWKPVLIFSQ